MNYPVPGYLAPFMLTGMIIVIRALLLGLGRALRRAAWPETDRAKALWSVSSLLVGWFVVAVVSSIAGFYRPPSGNPPTIQYGLLAPIVVGLLLFRIWPLLRRTLATVPSAWLVGVHLYRVLGVIFLVLYAGRHLSGLFALPAGLGDMLVGTLAPFVAAVKRKGKKHSAFSGDPNPETRGGPRATFKAHTIIGFQARVVITNRARPWVAGNTEAIFKIRFARHPEPRSMPVSDSAIMHSADLCCECTRPVRVQAPNCRR